MAHVDMGVSVAVTRFILLRAVHAVNFLAFLSLSRQVLGLLGSKGLLPVDEFLKTVHKRIPPKKSLYLRVVPTMHWIPSLRSDRGLSILSWSGVILACAGFLDFTPALCHGGIAVIYLSFQVVGRELMSFQWDSCLIEINILCALAIAPLHVLPPWYVREDHAMICNWPGTTVWRLLSLKVVLFKLLFQSGVVKLASGCPAWRGLTAMNYHYFTQPLPNQLAYFLSTRLPGWFHKLSVLITFAIELILPFSIFSSGNGRGFVIAGVVAFFMIVIGSSGNYGFFHPLMCSLCIALLDDETLKGYCGGAIGFLWRYGTHDTGAEWPAFGVAVITMIHLAASIPALVMSFRSKSLMSHVPQFLVTLYSSLSPYKFCNSYGLFARMTTCRRELIIQGSHDGVSWKDIPCKYKPGNIAEPPAFAGFHMPRLDWRLWFQAQRTGANPHESAPYLLGMVEGILRGSPQVASLLSGYARWVQHNPPRYIRILLYDYQFEQKKSTSPQHACWWKRRLLGLHCPMLRLDAAGDLVSCSGVVQGALLQTGEGPQSEALREIMKK